MTNTYDEINDYVHQQEKIIRRGIDKAFKQGIVKGLQFAGWEQTFWGKEFDDPDSTKDNDYLLILLTHFIQIFQDRLNYLKDMKIRFEKEKQDEN